jgi:hypothetical protein
MIAISNLLSIKCKIYHQNLVEDTATSDSNTALVRIQEYHFKEKCAAQNCTVLTSACIYLAI